MININLIIKSIVFFLPYTNSLVADVGFPLKIYEVLGIFLFIALFFKSKGMLHFKKNILTLYIAALLFFVWYLLSGIIGLFNMPDIHMPVWAVGRNSPLVSVVLKIFYVIFNVYIFFIIIEYCRKTEFLYALIRLWIISSVIVSCYAIYLFVVSILKIEPLLLPGTQSIQKIGLPAIGNFIRNATFKEGNFMGGYLVLSLLLNMPYVFSKDIYKTLSRKRMYMVFLLLQLIALFVTVSTVNILAFFAALFLFILMSLIHGKRIRLGYVKALAITILCITAFLLSPQGRTIFYEKIFGSDTQWSISRKDRIETTATAMNMAINNPVFGVGPTNFGLFYNRYRTSNWRDGNSDKAITNNIYAELLCETGFVGLLLFLILLYVIYMIYYKSRRYVPEKHIQILNSLFCGFTSILITFLAFPTFTLTFHWVFLGLFVGASKALRDENHVNNENNIC